MGTKIKKDKNGRVEIDYNGAVVCFQKFTIGQNVKFQDAGNPQMHIPGSPACLGYFNRVDVKKIRDFRKYVSVTSEYEAEYPCSRKQLLLRRIKSLQDLEQVVLLDSKGIGNSLPFVDVNGNSYALCCLSVFSISEGDGEHKNIYGRKNFYAGLAKELYTILNNARVENHYECRFVLMELLGAEDLCLIVLSNQYRAISDAIEKLQQFNYKSAAQNRIYQNCRVDNVHSILMMDRENEEALKRVEWDNADAEMHFSLHAAPGMRYLRKQRLLIQKFLDKTNQERDNAVLEKRAKLQIQVESCSGEYDAILRCPAWLLPIVLGLPGEDKNSVQGCFHPDNEDYRCKVYQSDTYIYPFGLNSDDEKEEDADREDAESENADGKANTANRQSNAQGEAVKADDKQLEISEADELKEFIKQAIKTLRDVFGGVEEDNSFEFQELPIWRLLKEFWSFASFPLSADLREDLECQFKMAINAIVKEAVLSKEGGNRADFMEKYQQIVKALDDSMQAGSQQDRWYFGEQQSYIENVESYYKILRCYYGMLKDMITMIYQIPRTSDTKQPYLIPMLSFGVNPLIKSNAYDSYVDTYVNPPRDGKKGREKALTPDEVLQMPEAKVISIKLPYQALSNPLKYLGILAHEIFHYASPADRRDRNELMCCALIRTAISEFIDILARSSEAEKEKDLWPILIGNDETFRELIDIAVNNTFANIQNNTVGKIRLKHIKEMVWDGELRFTVDSTAVQGYECYYRIWASLRAMLLNVMETDPARKVPDLADLPPLCEAFVPYYEKMFALEDHILDDKEPWEKDAALRGLYERQIRSTRHSQTIEARNLLRTAYEAMVECPPDIFDLEVVMHGKSPEEKIRQFFWQQYSAKRDLLSPWCVFRPDETEPLLKNDIRSAMIVSYYLHEGYGQDDPVILDQVMDKWGESNFKPLFANARKEFMRGYSRVYARFRYLFEENSEICGKLANRICNQVDREGLKNRLTKFYEDYYAVLEGFQRGKDEEEKKNERYDATFAGTCALIDEYQTRSRFVVKGPTSGEPLTDSGNRKDTEDSGDSGNPKQAEENRRDLRFECDLTAYNNSDLMYKLSLAYEKMMVNEKMPMLWYRGQRVWEWRTLPNLMRIKRMATEMPDHEGFAQTMLYEMQLARAHILPNGEHLSDAEWIAFLQHYEFKTNALDFSESLAPALFFATEKWEDDKTKRPEADAVIMAFNPVLFNLVMELFEVEEYVEKLRTAEEILKEYRWDVGGFRTAEEVLKEHRRVVEELRLHRRVAKDALMKAKREIRSEAELVELEKTYDRFDTALKICLKVKNKEELAQLIESRREALNRAKENLKRYLESGVNFEQPPLFTGMTEPSSDRYGHLYDLLHADTYDSCLHPRAVMVPRHCDRMAKQSGEFVYFGINAHRTPSYVTENEVTSRVYNYDRWSLESLHQKYVDRCRQELKDYEKNNGECPDAKFIPFLCRIKINSYRHTGFKRYVHAMGMHKFSVYPEYDKLADDLAEQLNLK